MSRHLSDDQFSRCAAGMGTLSELQHSRDCAECRTELNRFGESLSLFQRAVCDQVDRRISLQPAAPPLKPSRAGQPSRRWALVAAAAAVLIVIPFLKTGIEVKEVAEPIPAASDADAVMNRVNLHLSRSVPSPMEPLLMGLPGKNP